MVLKQKKTISIYKTKGKLYKKTSIKDVRYKETDTYRNRYIKLSNKNLFFLKTRR